MFIGLSPLLLGKFLMTLIAGHFATLFKQNSLDLEQSPVYNSYSEKNSFGLSE